MLAVEFVKNIANEKCADQSSPIGKSIRCPHKSSVTSAILSAVFCIAIWPHSLSAFSTISSSEELSSVTANLDIEVTVSNGSSRPLSVALTFTLQRINLFSEKVVGMPTADVAEHEPESSLERAVPGSGMLISDL